MVDAAADAAAAAATAAAAAAAAATPWHTGVDAEVKGHWENKGWKLDDPKEIAINSTKQARELERHFGVPADRLLKLPAADAKPEELAAFYQRLGAPKEAKEYDLSSVKLGGKDLDPALADSLREALAAAFVPKDKATAAAARLVKHLEDTKAAEDTIASGRLAEEKAKLATNWGPKYDLNYLQAVEGARKAGIAREAITAMEGVAGYANVMEHFRRVGAGMTEAAFIEGTGASGPTTRDGAAARLAELQADKAWGERLVKGDAAAKAEWQALTQQIAA